MKMKLVLFFALIFLFQQINGEINENVCQNWTEILQDQNMMEMATNSFYLGNEPLTVWLYLKDQYIFPINAKIYGHPKGNNPTVFLQIHGRLDCQIKLKASSNGRNTYKFVVDNHRWCLNSCPIYQQMYTPFKMWSENGPVEIFVDYDLEMLMYLKFELSKKGLPLNTQSPPIKFYLPENQMNEIAAASSCKQKNWLKTTFPTSDYTHFKSDPNEVFKNENGTSSVRLHNNGDTVAWIEVKDSAPEHFVIIQLEDGSKKAWEEENVTIGVEANGLQAVSFDLEKNFTEIQNGIKIYLKKAFCIPDHSFFTQIRYIFNVKSKHEYNFTATFYVTDGTNLVLKYLEEEKDGTPKPYPEPYNFEFFTILLEASPTTTTSSTSTSTTTSSTSTSPSTIENSQNGIDETAKISDLSLKNEIPSEAAKIPGFFSVLITILMAQKLFALFFNL